MDPVSLVDNTKGDVKSACFLSLDDIDDSDVRAGRAFFFIVFPISPDDGKGEDFGDDSYVDGNDSDDDDESQSRESSDEEPDFFDNPNIFERSNEHTHLQTVLEPPFWYGHEDEGMCVLLVLFFFPLLPFNGSGYSFAKTLIADQAAPIFHVYAERLQLTLRNNTRIREPKLFVGSIKRQPVSNCGSSNFTTLDEVSVFTREKVPFGLSMPFAFSRMLLTVWDAEEGLPSMQYSLKSTANRRYWLARVHGAPSFLYALPDAQDPKDEAFRYHTSDDDEVVGYAPISSRVSFAPWIPMSWLRSDLDATEDTLFGEEESGSQAHVAPR